MCEASVTFFLFLNTKLAAKINSLREKRKHIQQKRINSMAILFWIAEFKAKQSKAKKGKEKKRKTSLWNWTEPNGNYVFLDFCCCIQGAVHYVTLANIVSITCNNYYEHDESKVLESMSKYLRHILVLWWVPTAPESTDDYEHYSYTKCYIIYYIYHTLLRSDRQVLYIMSWCLSNLLCVISLSPTIWNPHTLKIYPCNQKKEYSIYRVYLHNNSEH